MSCRGAFAWQRQREEAFEHAGIVAGVGRALRWYAGATAQLRFGGITEQTQESGRHRVTRTRA
jgi:hypothetical protein